VANGRGLNWKMYDASTPEVRKWIHENIHLWIEKPE